MPQRPPLAPPQLVGLLLVGVAAWGRAVDVVSWVPLVGGVVAVGVLLLLIAAVGLLGAAHHHQVLLFFVSCGWGLGGGGTRDGSGTPGLGTQRGLGDSRAGGVLETWGPPEMGSPQGFGDGGVGVPRVGDNGGGGYQG